MIDWNCTRPHDWGLLDHIQAEALQKESHLAVSQGASGILLYGELNPIITMGLRAKETDIFTEKIPRARVDRGGATTLHTPGQLIVYPVLDLRKNRISPRELIQELLTISSEALLKLGIQNQIRWDQVGVWTSHGKIVFCGLRIRNGITQYGLSLNVSNHLEDFKMISSCGLNSFCYDSIQQYGISLTPQEFMQIWLQTAYKRDQSRPVSLTVHNSNS